MYLKEIKAMGFKSFADKISIDFENNITGVVGPNGSGKSNIVDAVRWVLGEQSVKSLRGNGSMTDVIFSGSKTRNPSPSASVTLVFDNGDHYFPTTYSEISIKRVVYNNADNEYYLNGEKCRLKDITNLVIDSGIGKEAFNIISQGNIQEILSNKPEDRRILFEEASGVLKYKKRKDEAIRKLDKTNDNINRINDIVNELEAQVDPLKEQSEKASIYLDAKAKLEQIEIALIVNDIETINNDYQLTKNKIDTLNDDILHLSSNNTNDQASLEKNKLEYTKDNESLYALQQKLVEKSSEVERLNGKKSLITERQKYNSEDMKLHDNILLLTEQQMKLKNDLTGIKSDIESKKQELEELDNKITDINKNIVDNNAKKELLTGIYSSNMRLQVEIKHKINMLEQSIENNNALPISVRNILNNPKLSGIHNTIGNIISIDDKNVTAIDISLGMSSQFIIVENENAAKNAISYLKNNNYGRATFFPINVIKARYMDKDTYNIIKNHKSFIDLASNLVTYDELYNNIILNQLGNVIIASDLNGANEIGKLINHKYKIVTLDGELLHVGGSITGGTIKKSNSTINEKYELQDLVRNLSKINEEINNTELKLTSINANQKEYEVKKYNLTVEKASLDQIINNKIELLDEINNKLDVTSNNLKGMSHVINNSLSEEEDNVLKEYYQVVQERDALLKSIDGLSKKLTINKEAINEMEDSERKANVNFYKKQNELKELEIKLNRMDVKLDTLLNRLNEEYTMTFEKAKKEYFLILEEKEARTKVNEYKNIIKSLGEVNIAAIEEYKRVSGRYEFLIEQKNDLFKAENMLLDIIKEMDIIMKESFESTFKLIQVEFKNVFKKLFGGGTAELKLVDPDKVLETGIDIIALPPGKKLQHISLLSGGEKALTAIALLFSVLKVRPVPFCLLDEVEAALDEVNVEGFAKFLNELKTRTQFIVITHKKKTMEYVDVLYGITMQESGVSKLVNVKLDDIRK
ncbi:MAG: AAA family ATPase [Bacilli bacterium]|nr:AAA family ATPase [Bacilli bacterium]